MEYRANKSSEIPANLKGNFNAMLKGLISAQADRNVELLRWVSARLSEEEHEGFLRVLDKTMAIDSELEELVTAELEWWLTMYAKLHLRHFGYHMEQSEERVPSAKVDGNIIDIREVLAQRKT